jgi:hypothetical protein
MLIVKTKGKISEYEAKCREIALKKFNEETVAHQYLAYYNELLAEKTNALNI